MAEVFEEYRDALAATGSSFEMNYVLTRIEHVADAAESALDVVRSWGCSGALSS